ncbi:helix-turn-helix domain-containing protein [Candidatus Woesearchaeota archaeon]|nr:helix-turn-helix domain-containing protein [Candidatus Woesearchaeota archaeon]
MQTELQSAGLTEGEAKVYLALLSLGSSTTGPIIEESGIARSFVYNILEKLIEKGLVSSIVKDNMKYYQAADPERILDYLEKKKQTIDEHSKSLRKMLPKLSALREENPTIQIQMYGGFRGLQTVFEHYHKKLKKGEETLTLGICPFQEEKYHEYWHEDHERRVKEGTKNRMLFNKGTNPAILKNRNSYKGCEARYMETDMETPAWIFTYKDVTQIYLQDRKKPFVVEIINKQIAETFKAYFEDYWKNTKKFK